MRLKKLSNIILKVKVDFFKNNFSCIFATKTKNKHLAEFICGTEDSASFFGIYCKIENVRELLYNGFGIDNSPKELEDAEDFHYNTFGAILEDKLNEFAEKYDLVVVKD